MNINTDLSYTELLINSFPEHSMPISPGQFEIEFEQTFKRRRLLSDYERDDSKNSGILSPKETVDAACSRVLNNRENLTWLFEQYAQDFAWTNTNVAKLSGTLFQKMYAPQDWGSLKRCRDESIESIVYSFFDAEKRLGRIGLFLEEDSELTFEGSYKVVNEIFEIQLELDEWGNVPKNPRHALTLKAHIAPLNIPANPVKKNECLARLENELQVQKVLAESSSTIYRPRIVGMDTEFLENTDSLEAIQRFYPCELGELNDHPFKEVLQACQHVAETLAFLHEKKILHRDVKEQNILIDFRENAPEGYLTDFGLSSEVRTSVKFKTFQYFYWDILAQNKIFTPFTDYYGMVMTIGKILFRSESFTSQTFEALTPLFNKNYPEDTQFTDILYRLYVIIKETIDLNNKMAHWLHQEISPNDLQYLTSNTDPFVRLEFLRGKGFDCPSMDELNTALKSVIKNMS